MYQIASGKEDNSGEMKYDIYKQYETLQDAMREMDRLQCVATKDGSTGIHRTGDKMKLSYTSYNHKFNSLFITNL